MSNLPCTVYHIYEALHLNQLTSTVTKYPRVMEIPKRHIIRDLSLFTFIFLLTYDDIYILEIKVHMIFQVHIN